MSAGAPRIRRFRSQAALARYLRQFCPDRRIISILATLDRADFLPKDCPSKDAHADIALPIADGATLSAPHAHAMSLAPLPNLLHYLLTNPVKCGKLDSWAALDVGSGSGYVSVALYRLLTALSFPPDPLRPVRVFGIDHSPTLVDGATAVCEKLAARDPKCYSNLTSGVSFMVADALGTDAPEQLAGVKFAVIHCGASLSIPKGSTHVLDAVPMWMRNALAVGGVLIAPVQAVAAVGAPQTLIVFQRLFSANPNQSRIVAQSVGAPDLHYLPLGPLEGQIARQSVSTCPHILNGVGTVLPFVIPAPDESEEHVCDF
jgi:protein-L-isoaspartate(D-aspartate) O-methyltransferase